MKILVLNGSPKGEKSNTLKLTKSFVKAFEKDNDIEYVNIKSENIEHCLGCFNCWTKTPAQCIIKDDMNNLIEKYINSDMIIWSFPLYYFGMPSKIKAFMDRLLPTNLPFMIVNGETSGHPPRYDLSHQKYILISTCGFYAKQHNYEGLLKQFDIMYGKNLTTILCSEGELFRVNQLKNRTDEYLSFVEKAGQEYKSQGLVSEKTKQELDKLLYPAEIFSQMADVSWNINTEFKSDIKLINPKLKLMEQGSNQAEQQTPINQEQFETATTKLNFMKQMSLSYNPSSYEKDIILEMYFTDIKERYQLKLLSDKCELMTENFSQYNTKIEVDFALWQEISNGNVSGVDALMEKRYKVLGDFQTMIKMESFFLGKQTQNTKQDNFKEKKTNIAILIVPWIALWALLPINNLISGIVSCLLSSLVILASFKYKLTTYDKIGAFLVSLLGIFAILNLNITILVPLTYFLNGLLWLSSAFNKVPITANYSCYHGYGGVSAFSNKLFIKTNNILSNIWIVGNLISVIPATLLIIFLPHNLSTFIGLFMAIIPFILGIFTIWFSKWYPAKVARG